MMKRFALEIVKLDGSVWYDFTGPTECDMATVQSQYDVMVQRGRAGNIMFRSFADVDRVTVTPSGL